MKEGRLVMVFCDRLPECIVEEVRGGKVVDSHRHTHLTVSSVQRLAEVVFEHSLSVRPFLGRAAGYVAAMPACIIS